MRSVKKTTLKDSPEATKVLTNIKPNEVSIVDMPANGEPFVVIKGVNMADQKLGTDKVPRPVMKAIVDKVKSIMADVKTLEEVSKRMPASETVTEKSSPSCLVNFTKSIAADLRSLQPHDSVPVEKRSNPSSTMSIHSLMKRADDFQNIEKTEATSYLTRDQYASVSYSVYEMLSTYVRGVETDDAGPVLIPDVSSTVDTSAASLEKLAEENPSSEDEAEDDAVAGVQKLKSEIENLKKALHDKSTSEAEIGKKGSKMAASRLKTLKSVSSGVSSASEDLAKIVKELEETDDEEEEEMETQKNDKGNDVQPETAPAQDTGVAKDASGVQTNQNGVQVTNDQLMAALTKFATEVSTRFDKVESEVAKANTAAEKAAADVQKIHNMRGDSRSGSTDEPVKKNEEDVKKSDASFNNLLGLK